MTLWVIKGGSSGERESRILENSVIAIGWEELGDLSKFRTKDELRQYYMTVYPDSSNYRAGNQVGQLWAFVNKAKLRDIVIIPLKTSSTISIGEIIGDYEHTDKYGPDMAHIRKVKWLKRDIPRTEFDQDLLYTFGAFMTFCKAERNNAEERIRGFLQGEKTTQIHEEDEGTVGELVDMEESSKDQIRQFIKRKFKGHGLARLVEAVFLAKGFVTKRSSPGPDGGVDILVSGEPMGFGSPKIVVQVKSSETPLDIDVLRSLRGTMEDYRAEQGLLVSLGGFKSSVKKDEMKSIFKIRLWDSEDLIQSLLKNYNELDETIKAELPLKRIWTLTREEEG